MKTISISSVINLVFLTSTDKEDLESFVKEIKTSKSVGLYSIPTNRFSCSVLSKVLVKLINLSFSEGVFPNLLKFSIVVPVFKKWDNLDYNNYRPISLISNIVKLVGKIL